MKRLILAILFIASCLTYAQYIPTQITTTNIPIPEITFTRTCSVIRVGFARPLSQLTRPIRMEDGQWGRVIDDHDMIINAIDSNGNPIDEINSKFTSELRRLTRQELILAGSELGLEWTGIDDDIQPTITMFGFIRKIGGAVVPEPFLKQWSLAVMQNLNTTPTNSIPTISTNSVDTNVVEEVITPK